MLAAHAAKQKSRSLKHATIGPAGANFEANGPGTPRAMARVGRMVAVDVDPLVDVATGEMHAHETSLPCCDLWPTGTVAGKIKILAGHDRCSSNAAKPGAAGIPKPGFWRQGESFPFAKPVPREMLASPAENQQP